MRGTCTSCSLTHCSISSDGMPLAIDASDEGFAGAAARRIGSQRCAGGAPSAQAASRLHRAPSISLDRHPSASPLTTSRPTGAISAIPPAQALERARSGRDSGVCAACRVLPPGCSTWSGLIAFGSRFAIFWEGHGSGHRHYTIPVMTLEPTMTVTLRQTSNFVQRFANGPSPGRLNPCLSDDRYCPAAVTRQTVLPTSSAINKAPVLSTATPTGRPRASPFAFRNPVTTSSALPLGWPPLKGTNTIL
jgi:hypothetical protein